MKTRHTGFFRLLFIAMTVYAVAVNSSSAQTADCKNRIAVALMAPEVASRIDLRAIVKNGPQARPICFLQVRERDEMVGSNVLSEQIPVVKGGVISLDLQLQTLIKDTIQLAKMFHPGLWARVSILDASTGEVISKDVLVGHIEFSIKPGSTRSKSLTGIVNLATRAKSVRIRLDFLQDAPNYDYSITISSPDESPAQSNARPDGIR